MLILINHNCLWLPQLRLKSLNHHVNNLLHIHFKLHALRQLLLLQQEHVFETLIMPHYLTKNEDGDFLAQTRRQLIQELPQLVLLKLGTLSVYEEVSDLVLELRRQVHLLHGCVCNINLFLK